MRRWSRPHGPKGSPEAAIDAKWTKERYHQPSDDLQQPLDLGAAVTFTHLVGDLSVEIKPLSDKDPLGLALESMVERLRGVVADAMAAVADV